jgi:hypothetical protein
MQQLALDDSSGSAEANNTAGAAAAGSSTAAAESDSEEQQDLRRAFVDALVKAGFSAADSTAAVRAVGTAAGRDAAAAASAATAAAFSGGRGVTRVWRSHDGLQPYLDWLCLALPVERLPARYRPGACVCVGGGGGRRQRCVSRAQYRMSTGSCGCFNEISFSVNVCCIHFAVSTRSPAADVSNLVCVCNGYALSILWHNTTVADVLLAVCMAWLQAAAAALWACCG